MGTSGYCTNNLRRCRFGIEGAGVKQVESVRRSQALCGETPK